MTWLGWVVGLAYPVGVWLLWHAVELERRALPGDEYGDPEPLPRRPPPEALTPLGWRRWRRARRFTTFGFVAWLVAAVAWFVV